MLTILLLFRLQADPSSMIKLYGKIIEFQNMQNGIVQKQVFQQVCRSVSRAPAELDHLKSQSSFQNKKLQQENSQMQKQVTVLSDSFGVCRSKKTIG